MNFSYLYDHNNGASEWARRNLTDWLTDIFIAPSIQLRPGITTEIRQHVRRECENDGWAMNVKIDSEHDLTVFSVKDDLAIQLQTGNMSRAPYDLLKLQYLKTSHRIEAAALCLPTKAGSLTLGSNIAHAERLKDELYLFRDIITIPILLVAFE